MVLFRCLVDIDVILMHQKEALSMETNKRDKPAISDKQLVGSVIVFLLRPDQCPTHPEKEWRGRVIQVHRSKSGIALVAVVSLEAGYEELTELVYTAQIIRIVYTEGNEAPE